MLIKKKFLLFLFFAVTTSITPLLFTEENIAETETNEKCIILNKVFKLLGRQLPTGGILIHKDVYKNVTKLTDKCMGSYDSNTIDLLKSLKRSSNELEKFIDDYIEMTNCANSLLVLDKDL